MVVRAQRGGLLPHHRIPRDNVYFIPKAAGRPIYSYRLSITHFWSLIVIYIWTGPHHLHWTALPDWTQTLGMAVSVMLYSVVLVAAVFVLIAVTTYWPGRRDRIERHGSIPLRDDG